MRLYPRCAQRLSRGCQLFLCGLLIRRKLLAVHSDYSGDTADSAVKLSVSLSVQNQHPNAASLGGEMERSRHQALFPWPRQRKHLAALRHPNRTVPFVNG